MKVTDLESIFDECFTHIDDTTGVQTTYAVTALYKHVSTHEDQVEKWSVPVEEHHAKYCITNRGVERDRLEVLMGKADYLAKPIMFIHMPDGQHLLVDGTHRYVCYWMLKITNIPAYMIPWDVAKAFVLEDAPSIEEEKLMEWSGLSVLRQLTEDK
jgi:hypothetical protein